MYDEMKHVKDVCEMGTAKAKRSFLISAPLSLADILNTTIATLIMLRTAAGADT